MLKNYNSFLNERNDLKINDGISFFIDNLISKNVPTGDILQFKEEIEKSVNINESLSDDVEKLKIKFGYWLDDRLFKWLINRKRDDYLKLIDRLRMFDLNTLDDVFRSFPGFKLNSLYLAGGMDAADDAGAGWRFRLEQEFELNNRKKTKRGLPEINIGNGNVVSPSYVVNGDYLEDLLNNPSKVLKMYDKPALLSPIRKELDRTKDDTFSVNLGKMKDKNYNPKDNPKPLDWFRKTFTQTIEPDDEHLLRIADAVFLGQDPIAGAGTYGELELLSLMRKPLFAWLVNISTDKFGDLKLWNIPHLCKVARNEEEMQKLVNTMLRYSH